MCTICVHDTDICVSINFKTNTYITITCVSISFNTNTYITCVSISLNTNTYMTNTCAIHVCAIVRNVTGATLWFDIISSTKINLNTKKPQYLGFRSQWASNFVSASASNSQDADAKFLLNWVSNPFYCLPEAGDIVTLPMESVSLVVAYSSKLFRKMFHAPALPRCFR